MTIDYNEKIPNNVDLAGDRTLQRALEQWQPDFVDWWREMGPDGSHDYDVYLRTAIGEHGALKLYGQPQSPQFDYRRT